MIKKREQNWFLFAIGASMALFGVGGLAGYFLAGFFVGAILMYEFAIQIYKRGEYCNIRKHPKEAGE